MERFFNTLLVGAVAWALLYGSTWLVLRFGLQRFGASARTVSVVRSVTQWLVFLFPVAVLVWLTFQHS